MPRMGMKWMRDHCHGLPQPNKLTKNVIESVVTFDEKHGSFPFLDVAAPRQDLALPALDVDLHKVSAVGRKVVKGDAWQDSRLHNRDVCHPVAPDRMLLKN